MVAVKPPAPSPQWLAWKSTSQAVWAWAGEATVAASPPAASAHALATARARLRRDSLNSAFMVMTLLGEGPEPEYWARCGRRGGCGVAPGRGTGETDDVPFEGIATTSSGHTNLTGSPLRRPVSTGALRRVTALAPRVASLWHGSASIASPSGPGPSVTGGCAADPSPARPRPRTAEAPCRGVALQRRPAWSCRSGIPVLRGGW